MNTIPSPGLQIFWPMTNGVQGGQKLVLTAPWKVAHVVAELIRYSN